MLKKTISFLLSALMISGMILTSPVTAFADTTDAQAGSAEYTDIKIRDAVTVEEISPFGYEVEDNTVTITKYYGDAEELIIPSEIEGYPVTCIGYYAFEYNETLKKVTIPETVNTIQGSAFGNCENLTEIVFLGDAEMVDSPFWNTKNIESVTFNGEKADLSTVSGLSIYDGHNIKTVKLGANVKSFHIGYSNPIEEIYLADIQTWFDLEFERGMPQNSYDLYVGGELLTELTVPEGITVIGDALFRNCKSIKRVVILEGVQSIGGYRSASTFAYCSELEEVTIPSTVNHIGRDAFVGCEKLKRVNISDLTAWCNIVFGTGERMIFSEASNPLYYGAALYLDGEPVEEFVADPSVETINDKAFINCSSLKKVTLHNGVKSIGDFAFAHCINLEEAEIKDGTESVGFGAFYGCDRLKSMYIPASVATLDKECIGRYAEEQNVNFPEKNKSSEVITPSKSYEDFIIYTSEGSQADKYGKEYDITVRYDGDPSGSDKEDYYIVGTMNGWSINPEYKLSRNDNSDFREYYKNEIMLDKDTRFKIAHVKNGEIQGYYPNEEAPNYGANGEIKLKGNYTVSFRPDYDGTAEWFYRCILVDPEFNADIPTGDADGDGELTVMDVTYLQKLLAQPGAMIGEELIEAADIDGNGKVEIIDATFIQRHLAGMEIPYKIG